MFVDFSYSTFGMMMMHLVHHAQPTPHMDHTLGICSMVQRIVPRCRGRAYVTILALTDGLQAFLIHLETHEDDLVPPTHWGAP